MFDIIIGWVVAAGAAALALWGVRWKLKAGKAQGQIDRYQDSSTKWQQEVTKRMEQVKREAEGKAPVDPRNRKDFE